MWRPFFENFLAARLCANNIVYNSLQSKIQNLFFISELAELFVAGRDQSTAGQISQTTC
jgi:hypothetical protein